MERQMQTAPLLQEPAEVEDDTGNMSRVVHGDYGEPGHDEVWSRRSPSKGNGTSQRRAGHIVLPLEEQGMELVDAGVLDGGTQSDRIRPWTPASPSAPCWYELSNPAEEAEEPGTTDCESSPTAFSTLTWGIPPPAPRVCMGSSYLAYCVVCMILTSALLAATLWRCKLTGDEARDWDKQLRPCEEWCEVLVGLALCTETSILWYKGGVRYFLQSCWRILDAVVAFMSFVNGLFFMLYPASAKTEDAFQDMDMVVLALRFTLQSIRMCTTAGRVARNIHHRRRARGFQGRIPQLEDPRREYPGLQSLFSPTLASQIREQLPPHLRFLEWRLIYSPSIHGTSIRTFYRAQCGPNILAVRDAGGAVFGGFAMEPWRMQDSAYGSSESFLFTARNSRSQQAPVDPESGIAEPDASEGAEDLHQAVISAQGMEEVQVDIHPVVPTRGRVVQWSDEKQLGFGHAIVVQEDFLHGSSCACTSFGTPPLASSGTDFVVQNFECWEIVGHDAD